MDETRVAVVTGAASGIGRATALELGRAGYAVAICDLDRVELERTAAAAGAAVAQVVDVSRAEDVARLAEACRERFGRVDVLVNNAGILRLGAWQDVSEDAWRKLFEVNLLAVARVTRALLPLLAASRGHVINLGSGASLLPFPGYAAYGPVKVGALWLSEYLRAELGPLGVRVSCVCPLLVRTQMDAEWYRGSEPVVSRYVGLNETERIETRGLREGAALCADGNPLAILRSGDRAQVTVARGLANAIQIEENP